MKEIAASESIENIRKRNCIYVDKTQYVYELVKHYERVFFSRPRRFGKSLTLNTLGTLFEQGVEPYFKDTWIYDKWEFGSFPVLRLNFLDYSTDDVEEFKEFLSTDLADFAEDLGFAGKVTSSHPVLALKQLCKALGSGQMVLLIDEYDCQLTANINDKVLYEKFRKIIRRFYGALKGKKQIKFLAVTGVTRLKDVSIFSAGSDIKDLTYESAFSQMIGFTREEIKRFYGDYLKLGVCYENNEQIKLEDVTAKQVEEFLDRMAYHYDGYCFDNKYRDKVFSTWSVNNFLQTLSNDKEVVFGDYWYDAGGLPTILVNYLKSHGTAVLQSYEDLGGRPGATVDVDYDDFKNPSSLLDIDQNVLMCQTGYLTLRSPIDDDADFLQLGFANQETARALSKRLRRQIFPHMDSQHARHARSVLEHGDATAIISHLNETLSSVSYDNFPFDNEAVVRSLLFFYVRHYSDNVRTEGHNYQGRSDLIVNFTGRVLVLEFKFSPDGKGIESLLESAVNQIRERDYGRESLDGRELVRLACVFNASPKERQITLWQTVE